MKAERKDEANQPDETPESDTSTGEPVDSSTDLRRLRKTQIVVELCRHDRR